MAAHSSLLAWRIPWTEELGGLQSMESPSQTQLSDFTHSLKTNFIILCHPILCAHSVVRLFVTPWTVAHQAPLSMGFSRQKY